MLYTPTCCCIVLVITVLEEFLHALYTHFLLYLHVLEIPVDITK